ncbi:MAG: hypothetical protein WCW44_06050 [archaeon]|jgi:hypothetical protein
MGSFLLKSVKEARIEGFISKSKRFKERPRLVQARILRKLRTGRIRLKKKLVNEVVPKTRELQGLMQSSLSVTSRMSVSERKIAAKRARILIHELCELITPEFEYLRRIERLGGKTIAPFRPTQSWGLKLTQIERDYHEIYKAFSDASYSAQRISLRLDDLGL